VSQQAMTAAMTESLGVQKAEVVTLWSEEIVTPLQNQPEALNPASFSGKALVWSKKALEIAHKVSLQEDLEPLMGKLNDLLYQIDEWVFESLQQASLACTRFNSDYTEAMKSGLNVFGTNTFYIIPVCSGQPDFSQPENILAEIPLASGQFDRTFLEHPQLTPHFSMREVQSLGLAKIYNLERLPGRILDAILPKAYAQADADITFFNPAMFSPIAALPFYASEENDLGGVLGSMKVVGDDQPSVLGLIERIGLLRYEIDRGGLR
ncbi:MAG: hypothetical protein AAF202_08545, partial [Pseudomonadota bacterium]